MTSNGFPTVADVARTNYLNTYCLELPAEMLQWLAIATNPRVMTYYEDDAEAVDETNWDVIVDTLCVEDLPIVRDSITSDLRGFRTVGVDEALEVGAALIDGRVLAVSPDFPELSELTRLADRLADYPLLDEDSHSEREYAAWLEWMPDAFAQEVRASSYDTETTDWLMDNSAELLPILGQHLHYSYGFSGEYGPEFLAIYETLGGRAALTTPGGPMGPEPMSEGIPLF